MKRSRPQGLHIIADLYDCDLARFALTDDHLQETRQTLTDLLTDSPFHELGNVYHHFGPSAATGVICLAESHVTFHTWPEDAYVSVDLFCCNSTPERLVAAEQVLSFFVNNLFHSKRVEKRVLQR